MRTGRPFTHTNEERLEMVRLFESGKTLTDVGRQFKCSRYAVAYAIKGLRREGVNRCIVCSKLIPDLKRTKFCSKRCAITNRRKNRVCRICGNQLVASSKVRNVVHCDDCNSSVTTQSYWQIREKRKAKLVAIKGGKCIVCGYSKSLNCLHFHHRDRSLKKFTISGGSLLYRAWSSLVAEVEKCDLLCSNCHGELEERYYQATRANAPVRPARNSAMI